jgi:hypothetical protein
LRRFARRSTCRSPPVGIEPGDPDGCSVVRICAARHARGDSRGGDQGRNQVAPSHLGIFSRFGSVRRARPIPRSSPVLREERGGEIQITTPVFADPFSDLVAAQTSESATYAAHPFPGLDRLMNHTSDRAMNPNQRPKTRPTPIEVPMSCALQERTEKTRPMAGLIAKIRAVGAREEALTAFTFDKSYDALRLALHRESGLRPEFRRRAQHPRRGA